MKREKMHSLLFLILCSWLILLSGCGTTASRSTNPSAPLTKRTPQKSPNSTIPSATVSSASPTDCPAPGTFRPASLSVAPRIVQPAVFYISKTGGVQTVPRGSVLKRYDVATGQTTTLLSFAGTNTGIYSTELSPDKRWLLFLTNEYNNANPSKLQLMDTNGAHLQTLSCTTRIGNPRWSPDGQQIAFDGPPFSGPYSTATIYVLHLTSGQQTSLGNFDATPYAWLDNQHLYLTHINGTDERTATQQLYLINTRQGMTQQPQPLASGLEICASFTLSSDAQQLLSSSCTPQDVYNCRDFGFQGPGSLNTQSATGGPTSSIYSDNNLAILAIEPAGTSILFYRQAAVGATDQSGLWIWHPGGRLDRLTSGSSQTCLNLEAPSLPLYIASNASSYALLTESLSSQSLQVGSINGGTPPTIAAQSSADSTLTLVGMA